MSSPDVVARHAVVQGHVQGVWFRAETRDVARAHGVSGWVRNRFDGTVEAHLEGPADAVGAVLAWIEAGGPPRAQVTNLEVRDVPPIGARTFTVTH